MMCTIYRVHPTGVGMIRKDSLTDKAVNSSSHRRGNDSTNPALKCESERFIPQAWEWFEQNLFICGVLRVHPTGVGMIRCMTRRFADKCSSSHRRGNDSSPVCNRLRNRGFIPQAWEWFVWRVGEHTHPGVHPTGVGMIRQPKLRNQRARRSSHRRGNDSLKFPNKPVMFLFIPQAWEWFDAKRHSPCRQFVHPTGVGMIRVFRLSLSHFNGSSHRRGNDSPFGSSCQLIPPFIPQAWEWFDNRRAFFRRWKVHPTGVGMIRTTQTSCMPY